MYYIYIYIYIIKASGVKALCALIIYSNKNMSYFLFLHVNFLHCKNAGLLRFSFEYRLISSNIVEYCRIPSNIF